MLSNMARINLLLLVSLYASHGLVANGNLSADTILENPSSPLVNACRNYYEVVCRAWARGNYDRIKNFKLYRDIIRIKPSHLWEKKIADELIQYLNESSLNKSLQEKQMEGAYRDCLINRPLQTNLNITGLVTLIKDYQILNKPSLSVPTTQSVQDESLEWKLNFNSVMQKLGANFDFNILMIAGVSRVNEGNGSVVLAPHIYPQLLLFNKNRLKVKPVYQRFARRILLKLDEMIREARVGGELLSNFFLYPENNLNDTIEGVIRSVLSIDEEALNATKSPEETDVLSIEELQAKYQCIDWVPYFNAIFASQNILFDSNSSIIAYQQGEMKIWNNLILEKLQSKTGAKDLQNYIIWSFIEHLTRHFPDFDEIRYEYNAARSLRGGSRKRVNLMKPYECLNNVVNYHEQALTHFYYAKKNDETKSNRVLNLAKKIHGKIIQAIQTSQWSSESLKSSLLNLVKSIDIVVENDTSADVNIGNENQGNIPEQPEDPETLSLVLRNIRYHREKYLKHGVNYHAWYLHSLLATEPISRHHTQISIPTAVVASLDVDQSKGLGQLMAIVTQGIRTVLRHYDNQFTSELYKNFTRDLTARSWDERAFDNRTIDDMVQSLISANNSKQTFKSFTQHFCMISSKRIDDYIAGNFTYEKVDWWDYPFGIEHPLQLLINQNPTQTCARYAKL